jgi:hypothetical protein
MPCHLSMVCFLPINMIKNKIKLENMVIIISISEVLLKGKGRIKALNPRMKNILKILEPTTLPIAISDCFL